MITLANKPPKGTSDWWPSEFAVRQYIFETWRRVNRQFGYQEYLTPLLESVAIYRAKSGEDVGGKELTLITDRAGRELAIRPEMTPSVTRMVSRFYKGAAKPLRLFSIANFWRNERPQRGRNREFWQLNSDIFGATTLNADLEILQLALELMLAFNPPSGSFTLYLNHRHLIDALLDRVLNIPADTRVAVVRLMDKFTKLSRPAFEAALTDLALPRASIQSLIAFMQMDDLARLAAAFPALVESTGYRETAALCQQLEDLGYGEWAAFHPGVIRGFDYYDGMVFEVFDNHPQNNRSLFGGGRYNGLASLFGAEDIAAVGFAPGDETMWLFLDSWDLLPDELGWGTAVYLPLLDANLWSSTSRLAQRLRQAGIAIEQGLETQNLRQALGYANRQRFPFVLLLGSEESERQVVTLKEMATGKQTEAAAAKIIDILRQKHQAR